ncbi:MAG TPA: sugar ABC transporter substrate-binding protein [Acidocella sp.]|nr:sugar ABC transporter substrate-binding protein [Acidocella sp.]
MRWKAVFAAILVALGCAFGVPAQAQAPKFKIFLSMSYIGNDWQAEAENMVKAMAASKAYADRVDLKVQVAGPDAQRQIQQINAMVQQGAQAIIVYPISPTALNQVIQHACARHIVVFAYDAAVTAPCAYNVHIDQTEAGTVTAEGLVKLLGGKGNVVMVTGVPGTSVDTERTAAAKAVFAKYPGIHIIASAPGMWSQAVARTVLTQILTTHPWSDINGLWMQVGCYTATAMEKQERIADAQLRPCAGEGSNGHRIQMLPADAPGVLGAHDAYAPHGLRSISYASPPYSGALALKLAVDVLEHKSVLKLTILPLPVVTNDTAKLCVQGSWAEMQAGCNVFEPAVISNPGWFASIYAPQTSEVALNAALHGTPEP